MSASAYLGAAPARLGVLGGGQLGRMIGQAAQSLGIECLYLDPAEEACAAAVGRRLRADFDDAKVLAALADACPVVTLEFENVPTATVAEIGKRTTVWPAATSLEVAQDRLVEKERFQALGIPVAPFEAVDSVEALHGAIDRIGLPCVLKTRRLGYDGKGQVVLRDAGAVASAWDAIGGRPAIVESLVDLAREVSAIGVRSADGETRFYPLSENVHRDGVLHTARPMPDDPLFGTATGHAKRLMDALGHVGVLAFEFFVDGEGTLLANEIAPRVHNSGHWSIEGAHCSQFENHVRAVTGLPLGETAARGCSAMINLLGDVPPREHFLAIPGAHLHHYGKSARPGRKVGHVTVCADDAATLARREAAVLEVIAAAVSADA